MHRSTTPKFNRGGDAILPVMTRLLQGAEYPLLVLLVGIIGGLCQSEDLPKLDTEHLSHEHWGLGPFTPEYVEPVSVFECRLSGECTTEAMEDVERLYQASTTLSMVDLIATLCGKSTSTGPSPDWGSVPTLFLPDSRVCRDPVAVLQELGMYYQLTTDAYASEPHSRLRVNVVTDPARPLSHVLPPQCLRGSVPIDLCARVMREVSGLLLCALQPLLVPDHEFLSNGTYPVTSNARLATALRHVCEPPPSQAPLPSLLQLRALFPKDGSRVMSTHTPLVLYSTAVAPSLVDGAQCQCRVYVSIEGQDVWFQHLSHLPHVHPSDVQAADTGRIALPPWALPLSGNSQPSWRCAQEAKGKDKDKGYGPQVCIDRFAHPGLRRLEVQARCVPLPRGGLAENSTAPDASFGPSGPRPVVLWRYVANLYHSPTPVNSSVAPALSLTLHCNTTTTPPHKTRFYSRKPSTLSGGPATTITPIKVQEWGEHLLSEEGRAGRASELCAQCPGAGAQCETLVATVLHEQVRETYYSEVWGLNRHLIENKVVYEDLEGSVLWMPAKVQALISAAVSKGPGANSTVCEIGFNAGHSALVWLLFRPQVRLLAFDLLEHHYASLAVNYLLKRFPNRIVLVTGDSTLTVPAVVAAYPNKKCDLLFIDGGHTYEIAKADIENFRALADENSLVIMDDTDAREVRMAWEEATQGVVQEEEKDLGGWTCNSLVDSAEKGSFGKWSFQNQQFRGLISTGRYVI